MHRNPVSNDAHEQKIGNIFLQRKATDFFPKCKTTECNRPEENQSESSMHMTNEISATSFSICLRVFQLNDKILKILVD